MEEQGMNNGGSDFNNETKPSSRKGMATASLVLGLVSILAWCIPLFGFPVTIVAIILGCLSLNSVNKKQAIAGICLGIVFLIVTLINSIAGAVLFSSLMS